jgi:PAS domain S-box-containing protein
MNYGTDIYNGSFPGNTEGLYRQIVETTNEGIWVIDFEGRTTYANQRMAEMLGCTVKELIGKNAFDFVFPEDRPKGHQEFDLRKLETGGQQVRFRYRKKDGAELWTLASTSMIVGPDGGMEGVLGMFTDITGLKRAQEALKDLNRTLAHRVERRTLKLQKALDDLTRMQKELVASENKYRRLAENTRDILILIGGEGGIEYIGPQISRYGVHPEDMTGHHLLDFVFQEDKEKVALELKRVWTSEDSGILEFRMCTPGGEKYSFEFSGAVLQDENSGVRNIMGVLRDISERRDLEELLVESEERRIKLTAALISAQDKEQQRISEILHNQVSQLLAAAKMKLALLDASREDSEEGKFHQEIEEILAEALETVRIPSFDLKTSILIKKGLSRAIRDLCTTMESRYGVHFDVETEDTELLISAEISTILFKAVRELLFNVVKHADVMRAAVSLLREGKFLKIVVEDQGRGFQAPATSEKPMIGKGLGLISIRDWLRDIGGKMEIDSIPGSRTTVTLRAPLDNMQYVSDADLSLGTYQNSSY